MPVLFIGHGSPMNAIENNPFSRAWIEIGKCLPEPRAILCISAHWETSGVKVTAMDQPETIHDFGGFPQELFQYQYPAPGSPELARLVQRTIQIAPVALDESWGLDHGTWSVLCRLFPGAGIPVIQLSLDQSEPPEFHYALGKELTSLRKRGILIVGSGNIVHNLRMAFFQVEGYDWAIEFDDQIRRLILSGEHDPMIQYDSLGPASRLAIPTNEHYLPLLYTLALQEKDDQVQFFAEQVAYGSLSMRSFKIG
ncbi:MAG: 4,5-DOPA dioxygenase extradiol [Omnitrophica WOR_2 bacterium]